MRVLIYKRTHTGDPNKQGVFGIHDCMGRVRALKYDAIIGVGGVGAEPVREGMDHKITWIGVNPHFKRTYKRGPLVTFEHFLLFDQGGPQFSERAPKTARRFYGRKARYVIQDIDASGGDELRAMIDWAIRDGKASSGLTTAGRKGIPVKCKVRCRQKKKPQGISPAKLFASRI